MTDWRRRRWDLDRWHAATLVLAGLAAVVAVLVATRVFPYHSLNHDEGVYLQQAAMLLEGRIFLRPPVEDAFRPWFFVEDGDRLYPKYAPVPAAVFAAGRLLGGFPVALAGVAAAIVGLTAAVGQELFDGRTGLLAGVFVLASPLFLVQSGVYLPYATTTALNLAFALAYLRAERRESVIAAVVAGAAVGFAFFARPYTAVLFAAPFVAHACWTLVRSGAWRSAFGRGGDHGLFLRRIATASLGTAGVAVALGYNWVVTGDPLLFPYEAFAPRDGIGFGHRAILGHEVDYTLDLAVRANRQVVWRLFTDWVVAGPAGTALAAGGVGAAVRNRGGHGSAGVRGRAVLAGLFVTIPLGNLAFWGNYNLVGSLSVATDGLLYFLGPFYHFDLLVPTAVFAAHGALAGADWLRTTADGRLSATRARRVTAAALLVSAAAFGALTLTTAAAPLERNHAVSQELAAGYEPFADGEPSDAVVLLPDPYGPWLNHPFQGLRNGPTYEGDTVYALGDGHEFDVATAYPDRTLYRYVYAGSWAPTDGESVDAGLREVDRVEGERVRVDAAMTLPAGTEDVSVRLSTADGSAYYVVDEAGESLTVTATVGGGQASLTGPGLRPTGSERVAVDDVDEVTVEAFVSTGGASGFTYRLSFPVERNDGTVRALSPTRERCPVPDRCVPVGVGDVPESGLETAISNGSTAEQSTTATESS